MPDPDPFPRYRRRVTGLPVTLLEGGATEPSTGAGLSLVEARGWRIRLLGLAGLPAMPADAALLIGRCRSVHTFGMRFALDLVWLDADGTVVRVDRDVPPRRARGCRAARSVVELPAGRADACVPVWEPERGG